MSSLRRRWVLVLILVVGLLPLAGAALAQETLTQTYVHPAGAFALRYPAGWVAEGFPEMVEGADGVVLADSRETLDNLFNLSGSLPPGAVLAVVIGAMRELPPEMGGGPAASASLTDAAASWLVTASIANSSTITEITVAGNPAVYMTGADPEGLGQFIGYMVRDGDVIHALVVTSTASEIPALEPLALGIAESLVEERTDLPTVPTLPPTPFAVVSPTPVASATPVVIPVAGRIAYGQTVSGTLASDQPQRWVFSGQTGDVVRIAGASESDTVAYLYSPTNEWLFSNDDSGGNYNPLIEGYTLPASGDYAIEIVLYSRSGSASYSLTLEQIERQPPTPIAYGDQVSNRTIDPLGDLYVFQGQAGDVVSIAVTGDFDNVATLTGPSGQTVARDDDSGPDTNALIAAATLPADGEYTIAVTPYSTGTTGVYSLSLTLVTARPARPIAFAELVQGTVAAPTGDPYEFAGREGDVISVSVAGDVDTVVEMYAPDGTRLATNDDVMLANSNTTWTGGSSLDALRLPASGTYRIVVRQYSGGVGGSYVLVVGPP